VYPIVNSSPVTHLSATGLSEYLQCPKRFALRRVYKRVPAFRPVALALGTAWHEALGRLLHDHANGILHFDGTAPSVSELAPYVDLFRQSFGRQLRAHNEPPTLFDDGESEEDVVNKARTMLEVFAQKVLLPSQVHAIEQRFNIEIIDPETSEVLPIPMVGSIDAIVGYGPDDSEIEHPPEVRVWELKSGARRWDENRLLFDFQPTLYRMATREFGAVDPVLEVIVTTKTRKPDVQRERLVRTTRDEAELMTTAASVYRALQAGCEHPVRGWQCKSCPFAEVCL
jgi:CRISPR/Cas system-associated exonuclease Cas4 (RecB family)